MVLYNYRKPSTLQVNNVSNIDTLVIHHTGNDNDIYVNTDFHINVNKWKWLGYGYYIANGKTYWVRGYEFVNAGVEGHNDYTVNTVIQGNYMNKSPSEEDLLQLEKNVLYLQKELPNLKHIKSHNELDPISTECCGDMFPMKRVRDFFYSNLNKQSGEEILSQLKKDNATLTDRVDLLERRVDRILEVLDNQEVKNLYRQ